MTFFLLLTLPAGVWSLEAVSIREYSVFPEGSAPDAIRDPRGWALFADGGFAVADGRKVVLVRPDGHRIVIDARPVSIAVSGAEGGTQGAGPSRFPQKLLIAESRKIRQFDTEGHELAVLADDNARNFSRLRGMAVDERGNVYVADSGRDVVFEFSPDGIPLSIIGENAKDVARLSGPVDVALDGRGNIFIADAGNDRVAIYSTSGIYRGQLGTFKEISGVAVDAFGLVYVADAHENRVQRFEVPAGATSGNLLGAFGSQGRQRGQFREISDVVVGGDGLLRVLDASNRSLHVLSWPGEPDHPAPEAIASSARVIPISARWRGVTTVALNPIGAWNGNLVAVNGSEDDVVVILDKLLQEQHRFPKATFREPVSAASDDNGRLYIVDRGAGDIKVFDTSLQQIFSFGRGSHVYFFRGGAGKLVKPRAMAISKRGLITVADADKVEVYGPDGTFMSRVGSDGKEPGGIRVPIGVAFGPADAIFVADEKNGTLSKFEPSGIFAGKMISDVAPLAVASDEEGRIYLLDDNGPRILVYNSDLEPLLMLGTSGIQRGGLKGAQSIAIVGDVLHVSRRDGLVSIALDLPLPAPAHVTAASGMREATVSWEPLAISYASRYRVIARTGSSGGESSSFETPRSPLVVKGLFDETFHSFRVEAINQFGNSGYRSESASVRTGTLALAQPKTPVMTYSPNENDQNGIAISWMTDTSPFVSHYAIEGWVSGGFTRQILAPVRWAGETQTEILPLINIRRFRIRPVSDEGKEGPASQEVSHAAAEGFDALAAGSCALAAEKFQAALAVEPNKRRIWIGLGEASEKLERFAEATTAYAQARSAYPADTVSTLGLARLALLKGDTISAKRYTAELLGRVDGRNPELLYLSGMVALSDEDYETAARKLALAVAIEPSARNRSALQRAEEGQRMFGENRPRLEIVSVDIQPIFPALYKNYREGPIGSAVVRNSGRLSLERIRLSIFIRGAMDFPSDTLLPRLGPGETVVVPLRVELSNGILDVTEDDTKQAEIRLTYYRSGEPVEVKRTASFRLYARTAMVWSDPRAIAAFVTSRSPVVAEFARNIAGYADSIPDVVNSPLRTAMLVRQALAVYGLRYQQDPLNPFQKISEQAGAVDYVQLPEETLRNRSGDCDDLVVLLAALLENLGVRAGFVDLPGHIILVVDSELPPEAASQIASGDEWIEYGGTVWIPIETTLIEGKFSDAVTAAEKISHGAANVIDLAEAWTLYPPVTAQPSAWRASLPDRDETLRRFKPDEAAAAHRKAAARTAADLPAAEAGDTIATNRVGIIYGKLGLYDEAEQYFLGLMKDGASAAALNNLGNIYLLRGDRVTASRYYRQAGELDPDDARIRENMERAK